MELKVKDIVLNESNWIDRKDIDYYGIGVIQSIDNEDVYIKVFEQDGSLSKFTTRYSKSSLEKINTEQADEVIRNSAFTKIKDSIGELKGKGEI